MYNEGISKLGDLINTGVRYDVIGKSGASYSYDNVKLGHGMDAAKKFLKENSKIAQEIEKKIKEEASRG